MSVDAPRNTSNKRRINSEEPKTTARCHCSNIDHDYRIRLGYKTWILDSFSRDEQHYLTSYANRRLVLALTLYHGLRNELILSSDSLRCPPPPPPPKKKERKT